MNSFSTKEQRLLGFSGPEGFGQPREEPKAEKKEVNPLYAQVGENREEKHRATYDSIKDRTEHYKQEIDKLSLLLQGAIESSGPKKISRAEATDATLTERNDETDPELEEAFGILTELGELRQNAVQENFVKFEDLERTYSKIEEVIRTLEAKTEKNGASFDANYDERMAAKRLAEFLTNGAQTTNLNIYNNEKFENVRKSASEYRLRLPIDAEIQGIAHTNEGRASNGVHYITIQQNDLDAFMADTPEKNMTINIQGKDCPAVVRRNDAAGNVKITMEKNSFVSALDQKSADEAALKPKPIEPAPLSSPKEAPTLEPMQQPIEVAPVETAPKPPAATSVKPRAATFTQEDRMKQTVAPSQAATPERERPKEPASRQPAEAKITPKKVEPAPQEKSVPPSQVKPIMKPLRKAEPKVMDVKAKPLNEQPSERKVEPQKIDVKVKEQPPKQAATAPKAAQVLPVPNVPKDVGRAKFAMKDEEKPAVKPVREDAAAKAPAVQPKRNPERKPAAKNVRENNNAITLDSLADAIAKDPQANEWFRQLKITIENGTVRIIKDPRTGKIDPRSREILEQMHQLALKIGGKSLGASDEELKRIQPKNPPEMVAFINKIVDTGRDLPGGEDAPRPPAETRGELHEERIRNARKITRDKNASPEEKAAAGFDMAGAVSDMALEGIRGTLNDRLDGKEKKAEDQKPAAPKPKEKGEDQPRGEKAPEQNAVTLDSFAKEIAKDPQANQWFAELQVLMNIPTMTIPNTVFEEMDALARKIGKDKLNATDADFKRLAPKNRKELLAFIDKVVEAGRELPGGQDGPRPPAETREELNAERVRNASKVLKNPKATVEEKVDAGAEIVAAGADMLTDLAAGRGKERLDGQEAKKEDQKPAAPKPKVKGEDQPRGEKAPDEEKKVERKEAEVPKPNEKDKKPLPPLQPRMAPKKFEEQRNPEFPEQQRTHIIEELKDANHDHSRFIKLDMLRSDKIDALWKRKDWESDRSEEFRNSNDKEIPQLSERSTRLTEELRELEEKSNALNRQNDPELNERRALAIRMKQVREDLGTVKRSLERKEDQNARLLVKEKQLRNDQTLLNELRLQSQKDPRELEAFEKRLQILKNDKVFVDCIVTIDADNTLICTLTGTRASFRKQAEKLEGVRVDGDSISFNLNVKYILQKLGEEAIRIVENEKRSQPKTNERAGR